ncbi:Tol-Pal system beta propeller repeat protein TolB [bacterium]|nr:Tol-Pal system beta propeller repeat protein TolB [candidate division CSSED10-310 bacterium]
MMFLPAIFLTVSAGYAADVYFDITASGAKKIDIALPLFSCETNEQEILLREIHQTFKQDFDFSGRFNVIDISPFYPSSTTEIVNPDFGQFYLVGIQSLVTGHISRTEHGEYKISMRLFDVRMGQQIVGIRYTTPVSGIRSVVHKFADEVQYRLTGERGVNDTRIAFTCRRTGQTEIYTVDPDGNNLAQITQNNTINISPAWSVDNTKLFFTSYLQNKPDLYSVELATNTTTPLLHGGMHITPAVSSDGIHLALSVSFDGDPEILIFNMETGKQRRITFSPGVDTNPTFAPNGRELAFVSDRTGQPQVYVMDIEGANLRRLTSVGTYNTAPDWSPRGDWIAYHSRRDGVFDIWMIHPNGSDEHPVTSEAGHNEDPAFARDGRHLVFTSTRDGVKGLYVMDVSGRHVRRVIPSLGGCGNPAWSR